MSSPAHAETIAAGTVVGLRYAVELKLGQGGNGAVYLASDLVDGGRAVALKVLRSDRLDAEREKGLRREYATLARLRHPHVEAVYDFGKDGRHGVYIAKEYLPGTDLMRATEQMAPEAALLLATQLFRALSFLHVRSLIHNDIKPDNVLVVKDAMAEQGLRSVLIDFGIASEVEAQPAGGPPKVITGTLGYLAPERLKGQPADARSEIYAAGILLFRLLARRYPFNIDSPPKDIMMFHLFKAPPRLSEARPGIPKAVDALMERLLHKDPAQRYQSARDVLADIGRILGNEAPAETDATQEGYVRSVPLVGRDDELAQIMAFVQRGLSGKRKHWEPAMALVVSEAGLGKTRLLTEILVRARLADARVLVGAGRKLGGALAPLRSVLRQLMTEGEAETALAVIEDHETRERLGREKMIEALGRLLLERGNDVVLALEDLHHADDLTLDLLFYAARRLRAIRDARLVILATTREGEHARIRQFLERYRVEALGPITALDPLSEEETLAFATRALSTAPPAGFVHTLHERTAGEPQALQEALKFLMAAGLLGRGGGEDASWDSCAAALPEGALPILTARLMVLPPAARRMLQVMALIDRPAPAGLLGSAVDLPPEQAASVLADLSRREIIVARAQDADMLYALSHDRIAVATLQDVEASDVRRHHERIARSLEVMPAARADDWILDLAHHAMRSGDPRRAARHGLAAGARMEELFAWDRAREVYEELLGTRGLDGPTLGAARLRLARVREQAGDVAGTLTELGRACRVAEEWDLADVRAHALVRGASLAARRGLGRRAEIRARRARELFEGLGDAAGVALAASTLAEVSSRGKDVDRALALARESRELHEKLGDRNAQARALASEGLALWRKGRWDEAARCFAKAWKLARDIEALSHLGTLRFLRGQHEEASLLFRKALALAGKQGLHREGARLELRLGHLSYELGELRRAGELLEPAAAKLEGAQDHLEAAQAYLVLVRLRVEEGRYPDARSALKRAEELAGTDPSAVLRGPLARCHAVLALLAGRLTEAREHAKVALAADEGLNDRRQLGFDLLCMADIALEQGKGDEVDRVLGLAFGAFEDAGSPTGLAATELLQARRDICWGRPLQAGERLSVLHEAMAKRGFGLLAAKAECELARFDQLVGQNDRARMRLESVLAYARAEGALPLEASARLVRASLLAAVAGPVAARAELKSVAELAESDNTFLAHDARLLRARLGMLRGSTDVLGTLESHARALADGGLVRLAWEADSLLEMLATKAGAADVAAEAGRRARAVSTATGLPLLD